MKNGKAIISRDIATGESRTMKYRTSFSEEANEKEDDDHPAASSSSGATTIETIAIETQPSLSIVAGAGPASSSHTDHSNVSSPPLSLLSISAEESLKISAEDFSDEPSSPVARMSESSDTMICPPYGFDVPNPVVGKWNKRMKELGRQSKGGGSVVSDDPLGSVSGMSCEIKSVASGGGGGADSGGGASSAAAVESSVSGGFSGKALGVDFEGKVSADSSGKVSGEASIKGSIPSTGSTISSFLFGPLFIPLEDFERKLYDYIKKCCVVHTKQPFNPPEVGTLLFHRATLKHFEDYPNNVRGVDHKSVVIYTDQAIFVIYHKVLTSSRVTDPKLKNAERDNTMFDLTAICKIENKDKAIFLIDDSTKRINEVTCEALELKPPSGRKGMGWSDLSRTYTDYSFIRFENKLFIKRKILLVIFRNERTLCCFAVMNGPLDLDTNYDPMRFGYFNAIQRLSGFSNERMLALTYKSVKFVASEFERILVTGHIGIEAFKNCLKNLNIFNGIKVSIGLYDAKRRQIFRTDLIEKAQQFFCVRPDGVIYLENSANAELYDVSKRKQDFVLNFPDEIKTTDNNV